MFQYIFKVAAEMQTASMTSSSFYLPIYIYIFYLRTIFEKVRFRRVLHICHKYHKDIHKYIIFWNHQLLKKYILKTQTKMQIFPYPKLCCCSCSKGDDFLWKMTLYLKYVTFHKYSALANKFIKFWHWNIGEPKI